VESYNEAGIETDNSFTNPLRSQWETSRLTIIHDFFLSFQVFLLVPFRVLRISLSIQWTVRRIGSSHFLVLCPGTNLILTFSLYEILSFSPPGLFTGTGDLLDD